MLLKAIYRLLSLLHFVFYPSHNKVYYLFFLRFCERCALRHIVPFAKAIAAAGGGGVLRDENRVTFHRRLPAIVWYYGGGQTRMHEIARVSAYLVHAFFAHIGA